MNVTTILKNGIVIFITTILFSCNSRSNGIAEEYFTANCIVYDINGVPFTEELQGELGIKECIGASNISIVDTIICLNTFGLPNVFELRNLNGDSLMSIGLRGNGPNDISTAALNGVTFSDQDGFGLWVVDVNNAKLKRLNLAKSISNNKSIIDRTVNIPPMVKYAALIGDSLLQEIITPENFKIRISESGDFDNVISEEDLYNIEFEGEALPAYHSPITLDISGNKLIIAMMSINQINILDLDNMERLTVSIGNVQKKDKVLNEKRPIWRYYKDVRVIGDKIIALYDNEECNYSSESTHKPDSLHILDLNGNVIAVIPIDQDLYHIAYSNEGDKLYALDFNENIWIYDLAKVGVKI